MRHTMSRSALSSFLYCITCPRYSVLSLHREPMAAETNRPPASATAWLGRDGFWCPNGSGQEESYLIYDTSCPRIHAACRRFKISNVSFFGRWSLSVDPTRANNQSCFMLSSCEGHSYRRHFCSEFLGFPDFS